jgi:hypothetical protein
MKQPPRSIVYRNIHIYRVVLNLIYGGRYRARFRDVTGQLAGRSSVLELCFGDTYVARFCRKHGIEWTGYDLNASFVQSARDAGYNARHADIMGVGNFPENDITVIQGSLYHFHCVIGDLFAKVFRSTDTFLVSEPVRNFSSSPGPVGWLARRSANAGKGHETFRYTPESLGSLMKEMSTKCSFQYSVVAEGRDLTLVLERRRTDR